MNYNINKSRKQSKTPVVTPRSLFKRGKKMHNKYCTKKSPHGKQELHEITNKMYCTTRAPPRQKNISQLSTQENKKTT